MLVCFLVFHRLMRKHLALLVDVVSRFKSFSEAPCLAWKCGTRKSLKDLNSDTTFVSKAKCFLVS
jgi:hypothetical protein